MGLVTNYTAAMRRRALAPGTIYARRSELARWLEFVGDRWVSADRHDVERWLDGRPLAPRARYTAISHLAAFYRWAIREGLTGDNPAAHVERPRLPSRLPRPVPPGDVDRLLDNVDGDLRLVVLLMADAGLRCCEVARLRWGDVGLEAGTVFVSGKGGRDRLVGLPRRLRLALYLAQAEASCQWVAGRELSPARVSQLVAAAAKGAGLVGVSAHRLRHTYATRLYAATGGDLLAVQQALGHASVATTQVYAAVDQRRAVEAAQRLD